MYRAHRRMGVVSGQSAVGNTPRWYGDRHVAPRLPELRPDVDQATPRVRHLRRRSQQPRPNNMAWPRGVCLIVDGPTSPLPLSVRAPAAADARRDAAGPQPGHRLCPAALLPLHRERTTRPVRRWERFTGPAVHHRPAGQGAFVLSGRPMVPDQRHADQLPDVLAVRRDVLLVGSHPCTLRPALPPPTGNEGGPRSRCERGPWCRLSVPPVGSAEPSSALAFPRCKASLSWFRSPPRSWPLRQSHDISCGEGASCQKGLQQLSARWQKSGIRRSLRHVGLSTSSSTVQFDVSGALSKRGWLRKMGPPMAPAEATWCSPRRACDSR
jgi:hypothetical protein